MSYCLGEIIRPNLVSGYSPKVTVVLQRFLKHESSIALHDRVFTVFYRKSITLMLIVPSPTVSAAEYTEMEGVWKGHVKIIEFGIRKGPSSEGMSLKETEFTSLLGISLKDLLLTRVGGQRHHPINPA